MRSAAPMQTAPPRLRSAFGFLSWLPPGNDCLMRNSGLLPSSDDNRLSAQPFPESYHVARANDTTRCRAGASALQHGGRSTRFRPALRSTRAAVVIPGGGGACRFAVVPRAGGFAAGKHDYPRFDLRTTALGRMLSSSPVCWVLRIAGLFLYGLVIVAGLAGA